ncbi:MAG: Wzz/FepE/Etk N-terminal domain-containing protein [Sediminibacterium sp.]|nr:Wzz/FepE/Etk N-terminal domain-containing protein [Sediminibacterium sp.]
MTDYKDDIIDISAFMEKVVYPFRLLLRHYKLTVAYVLLGVLLAIVLKFVLPPVYSASFIIKNNEKKDNYYVNMLMDLEKLAKDDDEAGLARELRLPEETTHLISQITLTVISSAKSSDSSGAAIVNLFMKQKDKFLEVQNGITNYLENSPHFTKLKAARLNNLDSMRSRLTREIREIDSVKKLVVNTIKPSAGMVGAGLVYNVPLDPFRAYEVNMAHYKEQLTLISQKILTNSFELIKPCVVSKKPVFPKLKWLLLAIIPVCILLAMGHAYYREQKQKRQDNPKVR